MSLDIHIGRNRCDAEKVYPSLSFHEDVHALIFMREAQHLDQNTIFRKLNDYYHDTVFQAEDVEKLKTELKDMCSKIRDQEVINFLKKFIGICDEALLNNANIYCFCD